jgi:hypothetical protein
LLRVFIVLIAYYSVSLFFFSLGVGRSVQGAMLIWPRVVCGSTMYHLAHLMVHIFPSHLGVGVWQQPRDPLGFSGQCEVEMLCASWWPCLQGASPVSLQDFTSGGTLSASSL